MKRCSICGEPGHNKRTCPDAKELIPTELIPIAEGVDLAPETEVSVTCPVCHEVVTFTSNQAVNDDRHSAYVVDHESGTVEIVHKPIVLSASLGSTDGDPSSQPASSQALNVAGPPLPEVAPAPIFLTSVGDSTGQVMERPAGATSENGSLVLIEAPDVGLTDAQWRQRQGRITSSLVPLILGLSGFGGPYVAWALATGRKGRGETSEPAELGLVYEEGALRVLARRHPEWEIRQNRGRTWDRGDWAAATPDGLINGVRLIEVKHRAVVRRDSGWGDPGTSDIPLDVLVQVLWQLWVCDVPDCVVALGANLRLKEYPIAYNAAAVEQLVAHLRAWWERYVQGDEEPTVADALPSTLEALRVVHGECTGERLEPDAVILELAKRRHAFDVKMKEYLGYRDLCDARIRQVMGEAAEIEGVFKRYEVRGRIDYKAVAEASDVDVEFFRAQPSQRTRFIWRPE